MSKLKALELPAIVAQAIVAAAALLVVTYQSCEMRKQSNEIAVQSAEMRRQTADQYSRSNLDKQFMYLGYLFERSECVDADKVCSVADDGRLPICDASSTCRTVCPFQHDHRLRLEAARALLFAFQTAPTDELALMTYTYTQGRVLALNHTSLPWLVIPPGNYERVNFHAADLRCADFSQARFAELAFEQADLRGVLGPIDQIALTVRWRDTLCPDGQRADDCRGHTIEVAPGASPPSRPFCDARARPAPTAEQCPRTTQTSPPTPPP